MRWFRMRLDLPAAFVFVGLLGRAAGVTAQAVPCRIEPAVTLNRWT